MALSPSCIAWINSEASHHRMLCRAHLPSVKWFLTKNTWNGWKVHMVYLTYIDLYYCRRWLTFGIPLLIPEFSIKTQKLGECEANLCDQRSAVPVAQQKWRHKFQRHRKSGVLRIGWGSVSPDFPETWAKSKDLFQNHPNSQVQRQKHLLDFDDFHIEKTW